MNIFKGNMRFVQKGTFEPFQANIYLLKIISGNTKNLCEICSKVTIKTPERSGVFIVDFEHIYHLFLVFLLVTLNK